MIDKKNNLIDYENKINYVSAGSVLIDGQFDHFDHFANMNWLGADGKFSKENNPESFIRDDPPVVFMTMEEEGVLTELVDACHSTFSDPEKVSKGFQLFVNQIREEDEDYGVAINHGPDVVRKQVYEEDYVQYSSPRVARQTYDKTISMVVYHFLRDLYKREKVLARLEPAIHAASISGNRILPWIGYEILPRGFMAEPVFCMSEYSNGIVRREAIDKFCSLATTGTVVVFYASGGGEIPQLTKYFRQIVVITTSDYDSSVAVKMYAGLTFVQKKSIVKLMNLDITYNSLLQMSPEQFRKVLQTVVQPSASVFLHNFFPELERFSALFSSSYGVYHLYEKSNNWKNASLPPRLPDCDEDSAALTRYLMRISPGMKPVYDERRGEVACYAQHAVFRDRVIRLDTMFGSSSVQVRLVDFASDHNASTRMKIVFRLPDVGVPIPLDIEMANHLNPTPDFPVLMGRKVYLPAAKLYSEQIMVSPGGLQTEQWFHRGTYWYMVISGVKHYVDYSRRDLLLVDKWARMVEWGFVVPLPSDVPMYDLNYAVNPYVKSRTMVDHYVVRKPTRGPLAILSSAVLLEPPQVLEIRGIGVTDQKELVSAHGSSLKLAIGGPTKFGSISPSLYAHNRGYLRTLHPKVEPYCGGSVLATTVYANADPVTIQEISDSLPDHISDHVSDVLKLSFESGEHSVAIRGNNCYS